MWIKRNLEQVWNQLRGQMPTRKDAVTNVRIKNFRGIQDVQVAFPFPVCVLAGANGCGKSTILYALGCAYRVPGAEKAFLPQKLFPDFKPSQSPSVADIHPSPVEIIFSYNTGGQALGMRWHRSSSGWQKSFFGRKDTVQPERKVYLHTLSKFSNPSEMKSVQQLALRPHDIHSIDAADAALAHRILGYEFSRIYLAHRAGTDVIVVERMDSDTTCRYSEYHMSAAERVTLRLSLHLSGLRDALVLIDEIDTGLHPYTQRLLMLELQRLALRNNLQIVCTTHSAVVLDTVPHEARIFLERTEGNVTVKEAWRDAIQKSLYGRSQEILTFLCEDEESEGLTRGILDYLGPKIDLLQNDIMVGRDSGKEQFLAHFETLRQFRKLNDVVFILDGDAIEVKKQLELRAENMRQPLRATCLPGNDTPEQWAWDLLLTHVIQYAPEFGHTPDTLRSAMMKINMMFASVADTPTNIAKQKIYALLNDNSISSFAFFRKLGFLEARRESSDVLTFMNDLENIVWSWRRSGTFSS